MGGVLKVLLKKGHWEYTSLKGDLSQAKNLHYGHFGDRSFEQLPNGAQGYMGVV